MKKTLLIIFAALFVALLGTHALRGIRHTETGDRIQSSLTRIVLASRHYHSEFGAWPQTLDALTTNSSNVVFLEWGSHGAVDHWGNPFVYMPFNTNAGCGLVVSWGADGKPGGTKHDRDRIMQIK